MKKEILFLISFLLLLPLSLWGQAEKKDKWSSLPSSGMEYSLSVGMTLGGSAPLSIPDEINSLEKLCMLPGLSAGAHLRYRFARRWSVESGLRFEMKRMEVDARTTHYNMVLIDLDGGTLQGVWTGYVKTDVSNYYLSVPVLASWQATPRWRMKGGLFFSQLVHKGFMGTVYDGYLRKDNPTGERIDIDKARYDFSPGLRRFSWGAEIGSEWRVARHLSLRADFSWGVNNIFKKDFKVLDFPFYPIYFTMGMGYIF